MKTLKAAEFQNARERLMIDDETAGMVFGVDPGVIALICRGEIPVPFLMSALTLLMSDSPKATQLAIEHGLSVREAAIARTGGSGSSEKTSEYRISDRGRRPR